MQAASFAGTWQTLPWGGQRLVHAAATFLSLVDATGRNRPIQKARTPRDQIDRNSNAIEYGIVGESSDDPLPDQACANPRSNRAERREKSTAGCKLSAKAYKGQNDEGGEAGGRGDGRGEESRRQDAVHPRQTRWQVRGWMGWAASRSAEGVMPLMGCWQHG